MGEAQWEPTEARESQTEQVCDCAFPASVIQFDGRTKRERVRILETFRIAEPSSPGPLVGVTRVRNEDRGQGKRCTRYR